MELRVLILAAALACVPESKRLVMPEVMRRTSPSPAFAATAAPVPATQAPAKPAAAVKPEQMEDPLEAGSPFAAANPISAAFPPAQAAASKPPARVAPAPVPQATPPEQRYVLRLVEHGRVWEVEMPEQSGGYEVRIPLGPPAEQPTLADQELLGKEPKQTPSKSYLSGLARIAEMYANHRYELALIELVDLEQQYPKDARIESMKGTLYHRLGKTKLAREAWKKALEIDPSNAEVAEALGSLKEE